MYSFRSGKPVVAGIEDLPPVVVVDVVEEVDACGDPRLDSLHRSVEEDEVKFQDKVEMLDME